jgi:hypothetical protein
MSAKDFITLFNHLYVENVCHEIVKTTLRCRGFQPKLTGSEVITMEIIGEFMGKDQDKGIWRYFRNYCGWFPNLGSRANFVKQSAVGCGEL